MVEHGTWWHRILEQRIVEVFLFFFYGRRGSRDRTLDSKTCTLSVYYWAVPTGVSIVEVNNNCIGQLNKIIFHAYSRESKWEGLDAPDNYKLGSTNTSTCVHSIFHMLHGHRFCKEFLFFFQYDHIVSLINYHYTLYCHFSFKR